jgi:small-conductance mechanosensitive channel
MPDKELAVPLNVGISYQSDLKKVEQITKEVAKEVMKEVDGGVPEFEPLIRFHTFGDFSINFTVILRAKEFNYRSFLIHEFIKRLHERYKKEGIEIPFPIRTVYLKSEKQN